MRTKPGGPHLIEQSSVPLGAPVAMKKNWALPRISRSISLNAWRRRVCSRRDAMCVVPMRLCNPRCLPWKKDSSVMDGASGFLNGVAVQYLLEPPEVGIVLESNARRNALMERGQRLGPQRRREVVLDVVVVAIGEPREQ